MPKSNYNTNKRILKSHTYIYINLFNHMNTHAYQCSFLMRMIETNI